MAQENRNQQNQNWQNDQDWNRDRNRYGNDYGAFGNNPGDYRQANYNRDNDRNFNRGGNPDYGNQYINPYEGGYNAGNYENRQQPYSGQYRNQQYGDDHGQGRGYDVYGSNQGTSYGYGGSNWQPNRGYGSNYNDYQNRGGSNYNEDDRRYQNRPERGSRQERDWWERTSDEIASWFGDEDAERRRRMDKLTGPHRGKGPRGYKRSDERIKEDINDRLSDDPFVDASDIDVTVNNGEVILSGNVERREAKRRAEDIAERVSGVTNVENRLRVSPTVTTVGSSNIRDNDKDDNRSEDTKKKGSWL